MIKKVKKKGRVQASVDTIVAGRTRQKDKIYCVFQPTLWLSSAVDEPKLYGATVLAESSIYFIFLPGSPRYCDVYRCESGRCLTLPFFITFFIKCMNETFIVGTVVILLIVPSFLWSFCMATSLETSSPLVLY